MSENTMTTRCRPMLTAAWLLAAVPPAHAGDAILSASDPSATAFATVDEGWVAGAAAGAPVPHDARIEGERLSAARAAGAGATDAFAGYHGSAGGFGYSALVHVRTYAGPRTGAGWDRDDPDGHAELSAGVNWKSLYASYDVSVTRDYYGIGGARGTGYLDVGARHPIGHATFLNLNAGDGRVAGAGNALWNWKDLRAGFTRKLEDGWMMVLNVRRVYGNSVLADRRSAMLRTELHPAIPRGHRGLVLTFKRGF